MGKPYLAGHRLGRLEAEVMETLWAHDGPMDVNQISRRLKGRRRAYTTVMTIATRLCEKGLIRRERHGRAFRYLPAGTREEIEARALADLLDASDNPKAVLAHFISDLETSPELIARLRDLLRRRGKR